MKTAKDKIISGLLTPLSWLYGAVTTVRNWLFDNKIIKEQEYDIPVIGVGNITVGGTGKTPHVEFIVRNLMHDYKIAVLSRGYKRKTKGFVLANSKSTPESIGDEPYQIYEKFGHRVRVSVCEDRRKGISEILRVFPDTNLILLDDSFQHRWVKPKVNILLTDYSRPFYKDKLLPLGRLRESAVQVNRADMVIVTKCPDEMMPINYRIIKKDLDLMTYQKLFFTKFEYGGLVPVFSDCAPYTVNLADLSTSDAVLLLTGIAHPRNFVRHFKQYRFKVKVDHYPDHHDFSRNDISAITSLYRQLSGERKIIVTTEKDAVRLMHNPYYPQSMKPFTFYLPIAVKQIATIDDTDIVEEIKNAIEA